MGQWRKSEKEIPHVPHLSSHGDFYTDGQTIILTNLIYTKYYVCSSLTLLLAFVRFSLAFWVILDPVFASARVGWKQIEWVRAHVWCICTHQSRSERGGRLAKGLTPHADQVIWFSWMLLPGQLTHSTVHAAGQRQKLLSCSTPRKQN